MKQSITKFSSSQYNLTTTIVLSFYLSIIITVSTFSKNTSVMILSFSLNTSTSMIVANFSFSQNTLTSSMIVANFSIIHVVTKFSIITIFSDDIVLISSISYIIILLIDITISFLKVTIISSNNFVFFDFTKSSSALLFAMMTSTIIQTYASNNTNHGIVVILTKARLFMTSTQSIVSISMTTTKIKITMNNILFICKNF